MTRRVLIAGVAAARKPRVAVMPTDSARLNAFANAFNAFTEDLRQGKADVNAWQTVLARWAEMTA